MSAITTTILSLVQSGDHIVVTDDSYKKTLEFCRSYLKQFAIDCTIVPFGDYGIIDRAIRKNTRFIFSESPTNPYLNIFDLVKIKKIADKHKVLTLIDSTFATPYNQRPIEFGMDLVLQSCTKYLAGHNDILAGAVLGREELVDKIRDLHKSMGGTIDPHCCYLLLARAEDLPASRPPAKRIGAANRRMARGASGDKAGVLSVPAQPSALRGGHPADGRRRRRGVIRYQRQSGDRKTVLRPAETDLHRTLAWRR